MSEISDANLMLVILATRLLRAEGPLQSRAARRWRQVAEVLRIAKDDSPRLAVESARDSKSCAKKESECQSQPHPEPPAGARGNAARPRPADRSRVQS